MLSVTTHYKQKEVKPMEDFKKMRTVNQCYLEIIKHDPDTNLTLSALRRWVDNGDIPSMKVGNRTLISLHDVMRFIDVQLYGERGEDYDSEG